jgi:surfeit locus 1 family protein
MSPQAGPRRGGVLIPIIFVIVSVAALASLGTWQLERKSWKEALIADLEDKLSAVPAALPPRERWPQLSADKDEFRRVRFPTEFLDQEAFVYTSGSAIRGIRPTGYFSVSMSIMRATSSFDM